MRIYKNLLRVWIALASIAAFVLGWIGLAHAPKPVQAQSSTTATSTQLDPLPPMPSLSQVQQDNTVSTPLFSPGVQTSSPQHVFRGRGS